MTKIIPVINKISFNQHAYDITFKNITHHIVRMYYDFIDTTIILGIPTKKIRHEVFLLPENINFILSFTFMNPDIQKLTIDDILKNCHFLNKIEKEFYKLRHG